MSQTLSARKPDLFGVSEIRTSPVIGHQLYLGSKTQKMSEIFLIRLQLIFHLDYKGFMTKSELCIKAQPFANTSLKFSQPGNYGKDSFYTAWNSAQSLVTFES